MDWMDAYLRAAGIKPTQHARDFLAQWQPWEGGATNNSADFNYMNTTEPMPGSRSINSVGVQAYKSLAQGAQAFAKTLNGNAGYAPLLGYLRGENVDPSPGLQTWVSGSPTGNPTYAAKVLGGKAAASVPSVQSPTDSFTPLTQPGVGRDALKQYAVSGLGEIARGESPTSVFADTSKAISSGVLPSVAGSIPKLDIPSMAQGGSPLDQHAASLVQKYLGVKYTWGGTSAATGFDCSGLVQTVWKQLGVDVPRTSQEQYQAGKQVTPTDLKPGDAVFFVGSDGTSSAPGHEGMYIGGGKYIAAPHTGAVVSTFNLADAKDFVGARRFS